MKNALKDNTIRYNTAQYNKQNTIPRSTIQWSIIMKVALEIQYHYNYIQRYATVFNEQTLLVLKRLHWKSSEGCFEMYFLLFFKYLKNLCIFVLEWRWRKRQTANECANKSILKNKIPYKCTLRARNYVRILSTP